MCWGDTDSADQIAAAMKIRMLRGVFQDWIRLEIRPEANSGQVRNQDASCAGIITPSAIGTSRHNTFARLSPAAQITYIMRRIY